MADTFRAATYVFRDHTSASGNPFTGTTYTLTLNNDLSVNYFVVMYGGAWDASTNTGFNATGARVVDDPHGNFGAVTLNANQITLSRFDATPGPWMGQVTVVECLGDETGSGFKLLDVIDANLATTVVSATPTVSTAWGDVNQVVPFGGWFGGGVESDGTGNTGIPGMGNSAIKLHPSATDTINVVRDTTVNGSGIDYTVFVVEWGSEWTVQRGSIVGGTASPLDAGGVEGAAANVVEAYDTVELGTAVDPAKTWLWMSANRAGTNMGGSVHGLLAAMGDGVNAPSTPDATVAVGSRWEVSRNVEVYALTHANAAADQIYREITGATGFTEDFSSVLTSLTSFGAYDSVSQPKAHSGSRAFALVTTSIDVNGTAYPQSNWFGYHTTATNLRAERPRTGRAHDFWVTQVDLAGVTFVDAAPQVIRPVATTNAGTWTAEGAATLHEAVDEETASFTDYIRSVDDPTDSPVVLRLGGLAEPASAPGDNDIVVHVQYDKEGGTATTNLVLELRQGYVSEGTPGTLIATASDADVTDAAEDGTISLTAVEAANITYTSGVASDLDVRIVADLT